MSLEIYIMALRGSCTLPPIERDLQLVYIYIYMSISISIYLYIYIYLYISIYIYIYLSIYIYIYICLYMKLKYVAKFEVLVIVNAPMGSWPAVICY